MLLVSDLGVPAEVAPDQTTSTLVLCLLACRRHEHVCHQGAHPAGPRGITGREVPHTLVQEDTDKAASEARADNPVQMDDDPLAGQLEVVGHLQLISAPNPLQWVTHRGRD